MILVKFQHIRAHLEVMRDKTEDSSKAECTTKSRKSMMSSGALDYFDNKNISTYERPMLNVDAGIDCSAR